MFYFVVCFVMNCKRLNIVINGLSSNILTHPTPSPAVVSEKDDTASLEELVAEVRSGMDFALHSLTATISLADRLGGKEKVEADKKAAEQKARVAALNKQRSKMLQDARKVGILLGPGAGHLCVSL